MAEFLTTSGTSNWIENIIIDAEKQLILISPYLQISKTFYERLKDASNKGVKIIVIFGKDELKPNERNSLASLTSVELYYFENLHAKCYFNENNMVITSMNMYEFSEKNNREMGVLISKLNDGDLYKKAYNEALSIKNNSEFIALKHEKSQYVKQEKKEEKGKVTYQTKISTLPTRGYCIRCGKRLKFNPNYPFCESCYSTWAFWGNEEFPENQCHGCGEYTDTSMAKPLCLDCFKIHVNSNLKF